MLFPDMICKGAETGLLLWFETVLPALLPFMILSNFMIKQNITKSVSRVAYPFFSRLFGLSKEGCYPAVIGLLSGYPLGAKTTAQIYQEQMISKEEAQYLLTFCNNASPMFLMEYMGIHCMGLQHPAILLGIIYLSAFLGTLFFRKKHFEAGSCSFQSCNYEKKSVIVSLDESILDAFVTITKVGGYIMLFTILVRFLSLLPLTPPMLALFSTSLEISSGIDQIMAVHSFSPVLCTALACSGAAFGGLCICSQTQSVLEGTPLSVKTWLKGRIMIALPAFLLAQLPALVPALRGCW